MTISLRITIVLFLLTLNIQSNPYQNIIDKTNYLTNSQYQTLSQYLRNSHLKILILDKFRNKTEVHKQVKKLEKIWNIGTKDIVLISYISTKTRLLTTYLGDDINTEFTSYTSNDILDRANLYKGGNFSDFLTMIYLLIVQPDNTSFSTKKTHFDKLEHATLEYKYLLEHYELPLTKIIKGELKEAKNWNYLYLGLLFVLLLRLKSDRDRWIISLFMGIVTALFSQGLDLGNPILVFFIFAIWSSFSKTTVAEVLKESKTTKKWKDIDENENQHTWDDDDDD